MIAAPGVRGITGDTVLFASTAGNTISLNGANPSLAAITFNSSTTSYTISGTGGGVLHLANGGTSASITVSSGSDTISAPLSLDSNVTVLPAAGSQLTISGRISGSGALTVNNPGKVVLSGANSYTGGTTVSAGTLVLANALAIAKGTSLTVGAEAGHFFAAAPLANSADRSLLPSSAIVAAPSVWSSLAATMAGDLAWWGPAVDSSDGPDRHHDKDVAIRTLDAVFAQYGR